MARKKADYAGEDASAQRREEIRRLATSVFASRGYASATMRDIADETGILAGSLYHYFRSKDDILVEGLQAFYADSIRDLTATAAVVGDPSTKLRAMIALAVRYLVERRDETVIIHSDFDYLSRLPAFAFVNDSAAEVERIWVGVLDEAMSASFFKQELGATLSYRAIMGAIFSTAQWYDPRGPIDEDEFVDLLAHTFLDGMLASVRR